MQQGSGPRGGGGARAKKHVVATAFGSCSFLLIREWRIEVILFLWWVEVRAGTGTWKGCLDFILGQICKLTITIT